jgi:molybdopterin molybdotransferase
MADAPLPLEEARARLRALATAVGETELVPLAQLADRVLAEPVRAVADLPAVDCSAMDGYALRHADLAPAGQLRVMGTALAGAPWTGAVGTGECVRITTGAALPAGADTVVIQEDVVRQGDAIALTGQAPKPGANVRRAGEDVAAGELLLPAGRRLGAIEIGVLATLGLAQARVRRRVRVALFASGDELRPPGTALGPGQIHDSNRYVLSAMLARLGAEVRDLGILPDRPEALRAAFRAAAAADLVLSCGGASVGEADYTLEILRELGEVAFWKVAIKPGKPFICGRLGATLACGLPGNPVSALVTFHQLVVPLLRELQGADDPEPLRLAARTTAPLRRNRSRLELLRARLEADGGGDFRVTPDPRQSSAAFAALARCNAFILVPAGSGDIAAGERVEVLPFDELL